MGVSLGKYLPFVRHASPAYACIQLCAKHPQPLTLLIHPQVRVLVALLDNFLMPDDLPPIAADGSDNWVRVPLCMSASCVWCGHPESHYGAQPSVLARLTQCCAATVCTAVM